MSWIRNSGRGLAVALLASTVAAPAATLVVRSSGPSAASYPAGKALADNAKISLKAGDRLVVLDGKGTRTLQGPGTFSPVVENGQAVRTSLSSIISDRGRSKARIGAVRGMKPAPATINNKSPNLWFVDIERSANICVADPAAVQMWRPGGLPATQVTVSGPNGTSQVVKWAAGESVQAWPAGVPITQGSEYRLAWAGGTQPTVLRMAVLGPNPQGLESTAAALIKHECTAQLDLLIETVAVPDAATAG